MTKERFKAIKGNVLCFRNFMNIISNAYNKIAPIDVPKMAKLGKMNNKISILTILIIN